MRLTNVLCGVFKKKGIAGQPFHFVKRTPGKVDIGKHRIVPDLKKGHKLRMWNQLAIEEENIAYISKPYLTKKEEKFLPKEIIQTGARTFDKYEKYKPAPMRSVYLAEILEPLNVTRRWEE